MGGRMAGSSGVKGLRKTARSVRIGAEALLVISAFLCIEWAWMPAFAEDGSAKTSQTDGHVPDWIITVGVMPQYGPNYVGSQKSGIEFAPQFDFRREGEPNDFSAADDALGYAVFDSPTLKIGPAGTVLNGRSVKDSHALAGLDNYSWRLEVGAFAEFWPIEDLLRTRIEVMHGLRSDDGFTINLGADLVQHFGRFTVSAGPRGALADSDQAQLLFGVSPSASTRNGRVAPFDASGGLESVGVNETVSYDWSEALRLTVFSRYDRLVGDAANSPITRELGSLDQFTVGAGITFSFAADGGKK